MAVRDKAGSSARRMEFTVARLHCTIHKGRDLRLLPNQPTADVRENLQRVNLDRDSFLVNISLIHALA